MSSVAFTIGSFGDILSIIQLIYTIRSALSEATGANAETRMLDAYMSSLGRSLTQINTVIQSTTMSAGLCVEIDYALADCRFVLLEVEKRIKGYCKASPRWKRLCAAIRWAILGGKNEVESLQRRLDRNIQIIQIILQISQSQGQQQLMDDTRNIRQDVLMIGRITSEITTRISHSCSAFYFMDEMGSHSLPVTSLSLDQFSRWFSFTPTVENVNKYATIMIQLNLRRDHIDAFEKGIRDSELEHILSQYEHLPWNDHNSLRYAVGCFIKAAPSPSKSGSFEGTVYVSTVFMELPYKLDRGKHWPTSPRLTSQFLRILALSPEPGCEFQIEWGVAHGISPGDLRWLWLHRTLYRLKSLFIWSMYKHRRVSEYLGERWSILNALLGWIPDFRSSNQISDSKIAELVLQLNKFDAKRSRSEVLHESDADVDGTVFRECSTILNQAFHLDEPPSDGPFSEMSSWFQENNLTLGTYLCCVILNTTTVRYSPRFGSWDHELRERIFDLEQLKLEDIMVQYTHACLASLRALDTIEWNESTARRELIDLTTLDVESENAADDKNKTYEEHARLQRIQNAVYKTYQAEAKRILQQHSS